jgi:hypothetical protein
MLEFLWVWVFNMREPITYLGTLGILICIGVMINGAVVRGNTDPHSTPNEDARWRQIAAVQGTGILALLMVLLLSIPNPQYNVRTVIQRVPVRVEVPRVQWRGGTRVITRTVPSRYQALYTECMRGQDVPSVSSTSETHTDYRLISRQCHYQSLAGAGIRPERAVVRSSYMEIFQWCNENYSLNGLPENRKALVRNERLRICAQAALQGSTHR